MRRRNKSKKQYKFRRKKKLFKKKSFWLVLFALLFFPGIFYGVFLSSIFQVKEIQIKGAGNAASEKIRNLVEVNIIQKFPYLQLRNIFFVKTRQIKDIVLATYPQLASVECYREFPDKLVVQAQTREPAAIFCEGKEGCLDQCFLADKTGIVFEEISREEDQEGYFLVENANTCRGLKLGDRGIEEKTLADFLAVYQKLKDNLSIAVEKITQMSETKFVAKTNEGWDIYFSFNNDPLAQIENMRTFLSKNIPLEESSGLQYIDLRFGNKVYYKFLEKEQE